MDQEPNAGLAQWGSRIYRWFGAAILSFFALVPAWIGIHVIRLLIDEPAKFDWRAIFALAICGFLTYFLALLAFRAFTGRGRKGDGGLLPPFAMAGAIHIFGVLAAVIVAMGIVERRIGPVLGGIGYLSIAYGALNDRYKRMAYIIEFTTSKFDPRQEPPNPINPIPGQSVLVWLRQTVLPDASEPGCEDWGWYTEVQREGCSYLIGGVCLLPDDESLDVRHEWLIQVHKRRPFMDRLTGRNKLDAADPVVSNIMAALCADPAFSDIREQANA